MKKLLTLLFCAGTLIFASTSQAQDAPDYYEHGTVVRNINYQHYFNDHTKMDLYLANEVSPSQPFVILIPGGKYRGTNKAELRDVAMKLMKENISSVVINYSNINTKVFRNEGTSTYKDMLLDVWQVIQHLQIRSDVWNIRKNGYVILGEEAGAHIGLLSGYKFRENVAKIIAVRPVTDFTDIRPLQRLGSNNTYAKLMGNVPYKSFWDVPSQYEDASPILQFKNVPTMLIHAVNDSEIPFNQSALLHNILVSNGIKSQLVRIEGSSRDLLHDEDNEEHIYQEMIRFIRAY